ncbi:MAG: S-layer homology domain-containing protein, partial [Firmicutes bacterium]|nr:S-layer homology domain-containing protein [Bacillota bacterium]
VKVTPDYGYGIDKLYYKEEGSSKKIDIEDEEFDMPAANVTIYATFEEVDATVIIKEADHGTAQADPLDAEKGDKVTITVKPDTGYSVSSVTVKDSRGKDVEVEKDKKDANKYTFTMPSGKATVTVSFFESACPSAAYKDVDTTQWYHEGVDYAVVKGLMFGTAEDTFSPNGTLSRAMLVTILYRMEGEPTVQGSSPFSDVLDRQWYTYAVMWANNNKIVEGYSSDTFGPNDNVTREQMAAIFYRYAKYKGADMSKTANIASYKDAADVSSWAVASMRWAVGVGLITGRANSMLAPQGDTSRAEAATMFMRLDKEVL